MGKNKLLPKMSCQQVVLSAKASHRRALLLETLAFRAEIKLRATSLLAIEDPVVLLYNNIGSDKCQG